MMTETLTEFFEESYTNHLDQTIHPGDEVVFVASGYNNSVDIRKGKYLGVRKYKEDSYPAGEFYCAVCEYDEPYTEFLFPYPHPDRYKPENIVRKTKKSKALLQLGRVYKIDTPAWELQT